MARDSPPKKDKKEKKKHKASDDSGVSKHKSKKDKSSRVETSTAVDAEGDVVVHETEIQTRDSDGENVQVKIKRAKDAPVGAMVPFAEPMADEKTLKKVLKNVKRSAKHKALKRGVKEVVKALRKSPAPKAKSSLPASPPSIVILAADISPIDVISHIPVLCEDHHVPYIYVPSRAELGAAGSTKRPTSVVMVMPKAGKLKDKGDASEKGDEKENWEEIYADMAKLVEKAGRHITT